MTLPRRKFLHLAAVAAALPTMSRPAWAQGYPARPVRMVVPSAPGGPPDTFARLIAPKLSERLNRQFVVENIPGAGGNVGVARAAQAPADGYTVLVVANNFIINPELYASVPYDAHKDFKPVTLAVAFGMGLFVNPSVPANSVKELVALVNGNPGKYSYTSGGVGTPSHLLGEMLRTSRSLDLPHIPFNGSGPAIASVVSGHVPIAMTALTPAVPHIRSGRLRPLAVLSKRQSPALPEVPTAAATGYADLDGDGWIGVFLPAASPNEIVDLLNREIKQIVAMPDVRERLLPLDFDPLVTTPDEFSAQLRAETERYGKVIRAANIKPE